MSKPGYIKRELNSHINVGIIINFILCNFRFVWNWGFQKTENTSS